jgi:Predicted metal-binding integral membrane protein (DUF2182)
MKLGDNHFPRAQVLDGLLTHALRCWEAHRRTLQSGIDTDRISPRRCLKGGCDALADGVHHLLSRLAGVMNVLWIAAIAALVLVEKVAAGERLVSRAAGAGLILGGVWLLMR